MSKTIVLAGGSACLLDAIDSSIRKVRGCGIYHYTTLAEAGEQLGRHGNAGLLLVYLQAQSDQDSAVALLAWAKSQRPAVPVVVISEADCAADEAAFRTAGAADYLVRPLNLSRLSFLVDFLTLRSRAVGSVTTDVVPESEPVKAIVSAERAVPANLVFASERSSSLVRTIQRLAQVDSNVLLTGETGTGKTCLARMMHDLSPRAKKPFVVVNCGAIPESLLESELFGHGQGAFTGADRNYRGKFAQAEDGTLFLDEIDSLPLASQSSLLRVVEERAFEAVGSGKSQEVASRLVFATNRNLADEAKAGRFRLDLYYRLNVVSLAVPPLRERREGIPPMVRLFLDNLRERGMTGVTGFTEDALAVLSACHWAGNVRELKNIVERVAVLAEKSSIDVADLPEEIRECGTPSPNDRQDVPVLLPRVDASSLSRARQAAERETIVVTLTRCRGNRTRAAQALGISRAAFYKKLNQLGISKSWESRCSQATVAAL